MSNDNFFVSLTLVTLAKEKTKEGRWQFNLQNLRIVRLARNNALNRSKDCRDPREKLAWSRRGGGECNLFVGE